jgi:hypothetical protein
MAVANIAHLIERSTGQVVQEFDLTGWWPCKIDRWFDGLVYGVDFERFYIAESLADLKAAAESAEGK